MFWTKRHTLIQVLHPANVYPPTLTRLPTPLCTPQCTAVYNYAYTTLYGWIHLLVHYSVRLNTRISTSQCTAAYTQSNTLQCMTCPAAEEKRLMEPNKMKPLEHWRALPHCALLVSFLAQRCQMMSWNLSWHHRTSRCHAIMSCDIIRHIAKWIWAGQPTLNYKNIFQPGDLGLWVMTLTIKLIWDVIKVNLHTTF